MRLATAVQPVTTHNVLQKAQFQIKVSATGFKILSSGLYSDKISAILREISCNAADAHIAIGEPEKAIHVTLPSRNDPKLIIQDFGPGLDDEEIAENYTTYFSSTKSTSDEFTGAFGLGSKSPFAYVDQFTVISAKAGKKRTYAAYIAENGIPQCDLMREEDTSPDWPHGVRVEVMARLPDLQEFQKKAARIYSFFKVPPELNNASFQLKKGLGTGFKFDNMTVYKGESAFEWEHSCYILCGNVAYPINWHELKLKSEVSNFVQNFNRMTLEIPVGLLDIAVSREALEYTERTRSAIRDTITKAVELMVKELEKVYATTDFKCAKQRLKLLEEKNPVLPFLRCTQSTRLGAMVDGLARCSALTPNQRDHIVSAFIQQTLELPDWIGNGSSKDAAIVTAESRRNGETVVTTKYLLEGSLWSEKTGKQGYSPWSLRLTDKFLVGIVDSKHGMKQLRRAIRLKKLPQMLILNPQMEPEEKLIKAAEAGVQRLNDQWLKVETLRSSTLKDYFTSIGEEAEAEDAELADRVNSSHESKSLEGYSIMAVECGKTNRSQVTISPDNPPYLYLTRVDTLKYVAGDLPDGKKYKVERAQFERLQVQITNLLQSLGHKHRGKIALLTPSEIRTYDPENQGFKPLWLAISEWMNNGATQKHFFQKHLGHEFILEHSLPSTVQRDHYGREYRSSEHDIEMLVQHLRDNTELAQAVMTNLGDHPVRLVLERAAKARFATDLSKDEREFLELQDLVPFPVVPVHYTRPKDIFPPWATWLTTISNADLELAKQPKTLGAIVADSLRRAADNYVAPPKPATKDTKTP